MSTRNSSTSAPRKQDFHLSAGLFDVAEISIPGLRCSLSSLPPHETIVRYFGCSSEAYSVRELRAQLAAVTCSGASMARAASYSAEVSDDEMDDVTDDSTEGNSPLLEAGSLVVQMELITTPFSPLQSILHGEMATMASLSAPVLTATAAADAPFATPTLAPEAVRWRWIAGMASGLGVLHSAGWLHNDIKPGSQE